ncbi:hypothetical protein K7W03_16045 [Sphingobium sp. PNB]|uniref:hypothetical protein n=1 Tax=Sphingobium sp. PNB TaxID=863934 RepID=UPI001CA456E6|nr:hypothetical protein [Sphingobium sp. PNB]MCB4861104.1 hypothetical protein [Sphingobium sp. PNB]
MNKSVKRAFILSCAFLCSCGGGESDNGQVISPPSPTPNPAPTPTPSPTPTPAPSYPIAFDPSQDFSFAALAVEHMLQDEKFDLGETAFNRGTLDTFIKYTASTKSLQASFDGDFMEFNASEMNIDRSDLINYSRSLSYGYQRLGVGRPRSDILYINEAGQSSSIQDVSAPSQADTKIVERIYLGGSATTLPDIPRSGTSNYSSNLAISQRGPQNNTIVASNFYVKIDHQTGEITATISAYDALQPVTYLTLNLTGTISSSGTSISGDVTSIDGKYSGQFIGRLFGPKGIELGLLFKMTHKDSGARLIGHLIGRTGQ